LEGDTGNLRCNGRVPQDRDLDTLIEQARRDPSAFGLLYDRYYSRILNYAYRSTLDVGLAEEVTSTTFFNALRGLGGYRDRGTFEAWLYRIAANEVKMHWRRRRGGPQQRQWLEDLARIRFGPDPMDAREAAEDRLARFARVHQVLLGLPEKYRSPLALRYFQDLPYEQVAQALGKKLGTVKSLIHRGLALMRQRLAKDNATFSQGRHP
jgi:RNA polymerase sigma-70 factor (ECF subfamily)